MMRSHKFVLKIATDYVTTTRLSVTFIKSGLIKFNPKFVVPNKKYFRQINQEC